MTIGQRGVDKKNGERLVNRCYGSVILKNFIYRLQHGNSLREIATG